MNYRSTRTNQTGLVKQAKNIGGKDGKSDQGSSGSIPAGFD
jgi:hypothetical protein